MTIVILVPWGSIHLRPVRSFGGTRVVGKYTSGVSDAFLDAQEEAWFVERDINIYA